MRRSMRLPLLLLVLDAVLARAEPTAPFAWSSLPALPDALGVAGPFAGVAGGELILSAEIGNDPGVNEFLE